MSKSRRYNQRFNKIYRRLKNADSYTNTFLVIEDIAVFLLLSLGAGVVQDYRGLIYLWTV